MSSENIFDPNRTADKGRLIIQVNLFQYFLSLRVEDFCCVWFVDFPGIFVVKFEQHSDTKKVE
jgi:hypothetical protein